MASFGRRRCWAMLLLLVLSANGQDEGVGCTIGDCEAEVILNMEDIDRALEEIVQKIDSELAPTTATTTTTTIITTAPTTTTEGSETDPTMDGGDQTDSTMTGGEMSDTTTDGGEMSDSTMSGTGSTSTADNTSPGTGSTSTADNTSPGTSPSSEASPSPAESSAPTMETPASTITANETDFDIFAELEPEDCDFDTDLTIGDKDDYDLAISCTNLAIANVKANKNNLNDANVRETEWAATALETAPEWIEDAGLNEEDLKEMKKSADETQKETNKVNNDLKDVVTIDSPFMITLIVLASIAVVLLAVIAYILAGGKVPGSKNKKDVEGANEDNGEDVDEVDDRVPPPAKRSQSQFGGGRTDPEEVHLPRAQARSPRPITVDLEDTSPRAINAYARINSRTSGSGFYGGGRDREGRDRYRASMY